LKTKICETCGKEYNVKAYRYNIQRFCSIKCRSVIEMGCKNYWLGKKRSKEDILKIKKSTSKENHFRWNGYFKKDWEGYIFFYMPEHKKCNNKGLVRLHRLVVEKYLGRELLNNEEVHHIDKNKENNNLINLMLFSSKSAHRRFEMGGVVNNNEILFDGRALCQI